MTTKYENPLLGVVEDKTKSLYERLEALVRDRNGKIPWQLSGPLSTPAHNRWPFVAFDDGLTHALMPAHATYFWGTKTVVCPVYGFTECGIFVTLAVQDEKLGVYENGKIVPGMLTCLQCLSGVATEGKAMRQLQKEMNFADAYGMSPEKMSALGNTNKPNMQQVPRTITGRMSYRGTNMQPMPPRNGYSLKSVAQQFIRPFGKKPP